MGQTWQSSGLILTVCYASSFLCLVPDEAKSSYQVEGTGYDTYLRDAHRQVRCRLSGSENKPRAHVHYLFGGCFQFRDYCGVCRQWDWRGSSKPLEKCNLELPFFEGHFLKVLFDRMGRILDQASFFDHNCLLFRRRCCLVLKDRNRKLRKTLICWVMVRSLCLPALWCEPAGDSCPVQAVFVTTPPPTRIPAGPLHQPGPRLQVFILCHRQGEAAILSSFINPAKNGDLHSGYL